MEDTKLKGSDAGLSARFANFWYYHKWHVIVAIFVIAVLAVCITQMATKENPDTYVLYAGEIYLSDENIAEFETALALAMGGSDVSVQLKDIVLLTGDKQATALYEKRVEEEDGTYYYLGDTAEAESTLREEVAYGQTVICLLDEAYFEELRDSDRLASFEELLGSVPEGAIDEYGIRIGETGAGQYFDVLKALPEDTVLCVKKPTLSYQEGGFFSGVFKGLFASKEEKEAQGTPVSRANEDYLRQIDYLKTLLNFSVKEG